MRNKFLLCLMAILPLAIVSCGDEKNSPDSDKPIEGRLEKSVDLSDDNYKKGFVSFEYTNGDLVLKHHVCYTSVGSMTDSIKAEVRSVNDEIVIEEIIDNTAIDFVTNGLIFKENIYIIENVNSQKYHVCLSTYDPVWNRYYEDDCFDIDLSATQCDSLILVFSKSPMYMVA